MEVRRMFVGTEPTDIARNVMRELPTFSVIAMVLLVGCATDRDSTCSLLIDSRCNIARQRAYVADTQAHLAAYVLTNKPAFTTKKVSTFVLDGVTYRWLSVTDTWLPIGTSGWFYFVCHSAHHSAFHPYYDIGDLSIGIDNGGRYYFSRTHVCGCLTLNLPASERYASMNEFILCNPDWHLLPQDWKRTAIQPPAVDIASHIVGHWRPTRRIESLIADVRVDLSFATSGSAVVSIECPEGITSTATRYKILSDDHVVLTNDSCFSVDLYLNGLDLQGLIEQPVTASSELDRLIKVRHTNSVEFIYSHTNRYAGTWTKIPGSKKVTSSAAP